MGTGCLVNGLTLTTVADGPVIWEHLKLLTLLFVSVLLCVVLFRLNVVEVQTGGIVVWLPLSGLQLVRTVRAWKLMLTNFLLLRCLTAVGLISPLNPVSYGM